MYNYKQPQSNWENQGWTGNGNGTPENNQYLANTPNPSQNYGYGQSENPANNQNNYAYGNYGTYAKAPQTPAYYPQPYYNQYQYQYPIQRVDRNGIPYSSRSWLATLILSFFLGWFGADHFYSGHIGTGILKLITGGGFGIWWMIDIVLILAGGFSDKEGRLIKPL